MKKIKNILCLSIVALCSFCMIGIMNVSAGSATNFKVVCNPESIEKGDLAQCYLLAKVTDSVDGIITKVYNEGSKNLVIQKVYAPPTKTDSIGAEEVNSGAKIKDTAAKAYGYECQNSNGVCYVFYAKSGKTIAADTSIADNGIEAIKGNTGLTLVGYYEVKLSDSATMNDCGRLCVEVSYSGDGSDYGALEGNVTGTDAPCAEVKPTGTPQPPTGSFTSYIVLIGGAFVAIGAIALARKNNKFFRV
jgi:hypothetical protein